MLNIYAYNAQKVACQATFEKISLLSPLVHRYLSQKRDYERLAPIHSLCKSHEIKLITLSLPNPRPSSTNRCHNDGLPVPPVSSGQGPVPAASRLPSA